MPVDNEQAIRQAYKMAEDRISQSHLGERDATSAPTGCSRRRDGVQRLHPSRPQNHPGNRPPPPRVPTRRGSRPRPPTAVPSVSSSLRSQTPGR
jgi:hypothetical protein